VPSQRWWTVLSHVVLGQREGPEEPVQYFCASDAVAGELTVDRPQLRLDGKPVTSDRLAARFAACWLPDEVVVYIGLSSRPLRRRLREYYVTPLGAGRPHAGGWFVKTLDSPLYVHYAATPRFEAAEQAMLDAFVAATSASARANLRDQARPIPFANLRWVGHGRKQHGLDGARD